MYLNYHKRRDYPPISHKENQNFRKWAIILRKQTTINLYNNKLSMLPFNVYKIHGYIGILAIKNSNW